MSSIILKVLRMLVIGCVFSVALVVAIIAGNEWDTKDGTPRLVALHKKTGEVIDGQIVSQWPNMTVKKATGELLAFSGQELRSMSIAFKGESTSMADSWRAWVPPLAVIFVGSVLWFGRRRLGLVKE
jgi:formate/nitrite transporter FocA (FNT family)